MRIGLLHYRRVMLSCGLSFIVGMAVGLPAIAQEAAPADSAAPATSTETPAEGTPPAENEQVNAQQVLEKGQEALKTGDYPAAYAAFDQLARAGEQQVSQEAFQLRLVGYTGRGQALAGMKEYEPALEEFKLATDLDESFPPALIARGKMLLDLGGGDNYTAALIDFQKALKRDRKNADAQFGLGKALTLTGNYQPAIGPLTKAIEAAPENAEVYRLRGTAYAGVFKLKEAVADFNKSIELNPKDFETYFSFGALELRNENYKEAVDLFGKAIELYQPKDPEDTMPFVQGYLTRSSALVELGKTLKDPAARKEAFQSAVNEAEAVLTQLDKKNPYMASVRAGALYSRGIGERMLGQLDKAIRTFSEAIELNPEMAEAYFRRGICHHYLGEDRSAIADFVESANINFEDPRANLWEGFTHAKMGNYQEALRAYGNAIAASDRYTPAYMNRGLAYMALGQYDKALADFNDAVRLEPTNADYYFKRGLAYETLGDYPKASESFASAAELDDSHAGAFRHLAEAMRRQGRADLAEQYGRRAAELAAPKQAQ